MPVGYQDYYETLGVPRDASENDIRAAYRKLVRKYHPDVNNEPDAEDRFKQVAEAYEVLRDPERRERYDRLGPAWHAGDDVSSSQGFGAGGYGDVRMDFGSDQDFSDFFESMFGGPGSSGRGFGSRPRRGADYEAALELTLQQAAAGGAQHLRLDNGRDYTVNVPAGVHDGQRIRMAGEGAEGVNGGPRGDLFLRVHIAPHPGILVEGHDLHVEVDVSPSQAALGARVPVRTLNGVVTATLPAGSSSGRRLRLHGEGIPIPGGGHGDLFARIRIVVPKQIDDRQRELYEQLAVASAPGSQEATT